MSVLIRQNPDNIVDDSNCAPPPKVDYVEEIEKVFDRDRPTADNNPVLVLSHGTPTLLPRNSPSSDGNTQTVGSTDPNEKIGPAGFGPERFVAMGGVFAYRINFENLESATAPAQQVEIRDSLDANLDYNTLELTSIGFGDILVAIPPGRQHFETVIDVSQGDQDFQVHVMVDFRFETGALYARFQSIDPLTTLPPNALTGFLPPEDGTGRGQGHISYVVRPLADLVTGDEIRNVALITFDSQQSIATNQVDPLDPAQGTDPALEALNTIDIAAPTSHTDPLLPITVTEEFTVSWSATDDAGGSGIGSVDLFVSVDGGEFMPFLWDRVTRRPFLPVCLDTPTRFIQRQSTTWAIGSPRRLPRKQQQHLRNPLPISISTATPTATTFSSGSLALAFLAAPRWPMEIRMAMATSMATIF